jgi:hypothetical protein
LGFRLVAVGVGVAVGVVVAVAVGVAVAVAVAVVVGVAVGVGVAVAVGVVVAVVVVVGRNIVDIAIAHCGWLPERKRTLARLLEQLAPRKPMIFASYVKEHACRWATRAWEWCAEHDRDGVILLNDDVILHPNFLEICEVMVDAVPDDLISLHANMPDAKAAREAGHPWVRSYAYTGPAVILPPGMALRLLNWEAPWLVLSRINEDERANFAMWSWQRPAWCAIPAIVTHDTSVSSTLGYDGHPNRSAAVPWESFADLDLTRPGYWRPREDTPHVTNPWCSPERLEYFRQLLARGALPCFICMAAEGVVGAKGGPGLCQKCVGTCAYALLAGVSQ